MKIAIADSMLNTGQTITTAFSYPRIPHNPHTHFLQWQASSSAKRKVSGKVYKSFKRDESSSRSKFIHNGRRRKEEKSGGGE